MPTFQQQKKKKTVKDTTFCEELFVKSETSPDCFTTNMYATDMNQN